LRWSPYRCLEARWRCSERRKLEEEIGRLHGKLANAGFVAKAPAEVVEGERAKLAKLEAELEAAR
jgi:valyl-tRNA synthetase